MKRLAAIGLALPLLLQAIAAGPAVAATDRLTPDQRAWLAEHPRIVLSVGAAWAPDVIRLAIRAGIASVD